MKTINLTHQRVALVDDEDYATLNKVEWSYLNGYAVRYIEESGKTKVIRMHRVIMQTPDTLQTDHRDMNRLNNQRNNLRNCTHAENMHNRGKLKNNTSGYKGVSWHSGVKKWRAKISINGLYTYLGFFFTAESAYAAYVEACKLYHGEFARV